MADAGRFMQRRFGKSGRVSEPDLDLWRRETFVLPRPVARERAREFLRRFPKAAYQSEVESWRELDNGDIEFTMRRLPSAD